MKRLGGVWALALIVAGTHAFAAENPAAVLLDAEP